MERTGDRYCSGFWGQLCTIGGKGEKVSRLNKEAEGGDSAAPPLPGAQLQKPLSLESSPRAFPIRFGSAYSGCTRVANTQVRESGGVARPTQREEEAQPAPCPDNTRPGLSTQEAPPHRTPVTKWGKGTPRIVESLLDSPSIPPASPQIRCTLSRSWS